MRAVVAVVLGVVQQQRGIHIVARRLVLVVAVIDRVGQLVRQPLGLPGALSRQHPRHGLQQQAEQQEPGGKGGFHSG